MKEEKKIAGIFRSFLKYELEDIGNLFGTHLRSRMKKSEMIEGLAYYISSYPEKWLAHMPERDLRLLGMLVEAGPDKEMELDFPPYPSVLEAAGLVDYDDSDGNFHRVRLRKEIFEIAAPYVDGAIADGERSGFFDIERVVLGYLNLYGVVDFDYFIDLMVDYCENRFGPDLLRLKEYFRYSPLLKLCHRSEPGKLWNHVCSPCVESPEEVVSGRALYGGVESFRRFSWEEAMAAGRNAPFFTCGLGSPEASAMEDMLRSFGNDDNGVMLEMHDIWMNSQMLDGDIADTVFDTVTRYGDRIGSLDKYNECLHIIADYVNSLPKWLLKGYSPEESGYMRVVLKPDPAYRTAPVCEDSPRWSMPRPTISEGYTDLIEKNGALEKLSSILPEGFPFGMAIPHVAPDDPCPCGSGLKYRNCHGRNLS